VTLASVSAASSRSSDEWLVFDVMKLDFGAGGNKKKVQGRFKKANNDQGGDDWACFCQDRKCIKSV
jgi:hypothetical protein